MNTPNVQAALDHLRAEVGPFTAFVAGMPVKYTVAIFVVGFAAGALLF